MNISEQLILLQDIKDNFKSKLIETGAEIDDDTPFSQYPNYIKASDNSKIADAVLAHNQPKTIKEQVSIITAEHITYEKIETE